MCVPGRGPKNSCSRSCAIGVDYIRRLATVHVTLATKVRARW